MKIKQKKSGVVLITVVVFAALGGVLATALLYGTGSQIKSTARQIRYEKAFFIAEAGVERTKAELRSGIRTLNEELAGADGTGNTSDDGVPAFGSSSNFGGGIFQARITDNNDGDTNLFVDADEIVIIWSTGTYENATRVLEVAVNVTENDFPPPATDGAVGVYGTNTTISAAGNALIDGNDYNMPSNFYCQGGNCNGTLTTNPAMPGVFSATTSTVVTTSGSGDIVGNPPTTNGTSQFGTNYWQDMADAWIPQATLTLTGGTHNANTTSNNPWLGSRDNPQITVVDGDTTLNGNVDGAGVLIVMNGIDLALGGNFHYEGIIIFLGNNNFTATGTVRVFGAIVTTGGRGNITTAQGTPAILYSSQALANLKNLQLSPQPLTVVYWREVR